jgi:hypothetical protein
VSEDTARLICSERTLRTSDFEVNEPRPEFSVTRAIEQCARSAAAGGSMVGISFLGADSMLLGDFYWSRNLYHCRACRYHQGGECEGCMVSVLVLCPPPTPPTKRNHATTAPHAFASD